MYRGAPPKGAGGAGSAFNLSPHRELQTATVVAAALLASAPLTGDGYVVYTYTPFVYAGVRSFTAKRTLPPHHKVGG